MVYAISILFPMHLELMQRLDYRSCNYITISYLKFCFNIRELVYFYTNLPLEMLYQIILQILYSTCAEYQIKYLFFTLTIYYFCKYIASNNSALRDWYLV